MQAVMGSIQHFQDAQLERACNGVSAFEVASLSADDLGAPLTPELVLFAWFIVLLRTQEDGQVSFEWASQNGQPTSLHASEVMQGLDSKAEDVVAAIFQRVTYCSSLLLSTGTLSESEDEVSFLCPG